MHTRSHRKLLKFSALMLMLSITTVGFRLPQLQAQPATKKPNILIIWGDDIGWFNVSP